MPFKSVAQQRYLFANLPGVARRFADKTPKGAYKGLPYKVGGPTAIPKGVRGAVQRRRAAMKTGGK